MNSHTTPTWLTRLLTLLIAFNIPSPLTAQRPSTDPHLAYVFPAGCQKGTTREVVLGGQYLKAATAAYVTGEGVQVEIIKWYRPLTRGEHNKLRMAFTSARKKLVDEGDKNPSQELIAATAGISAEELREMDIFLQRDRDPKRQPNEQLEEELTLQVTVAPDAKPGKRELRILTETSISNPIWFQVGRWNEVCEVEPNDTTPDTAIHQMPVVINGQIMPGDADSFSFEAKKGERLVIMAGARDVIPYLADAVPGWFQAVLSLSDSEGNEVSYADSYQYRQDPVIYFEVPDDDRYTLEIRDSIYRGREDFVYRITLGELPFVTTVFPLGARWNSKVSVQMQGWNLAPTETEIDTTSKRQYRPVQWFSAEQTEGTSVHFPMQIDRLREIFDEEPNNAPESAQEVSTRMIVNGRIDYPGDHDLFRVTGQGRLVAEVFARRAGSPLDSVLTLFDADGKELAFNDDYEDKSQGLSTHHADSHLVASVPASGCFLRLGDTQQNGGSDFVYRLYLRAPEPDYELRVTPASIVARSGSQTPITVYALRQDDFDHDIELALVDPPPGFELSGAVIPGSSEQVQLTLSVPADPPEGPLTLEMIGRARRGHGDRTWITRPAIPAENRMQAFIWYHLVPVEDWTLVVGGKPAPKPPFEIVLDKPRLTLPRQGERVLPIRPLRKGLVFEEYGVELSSPSGVAAELVRGAMGRVGIKFTTVATEIESGTAGNLLVNVYREKTAAATEENPNPKPWRSEYGPLPAIPFEISGR